jgi:flavin-binding protein dodecin
MTEATGYRGEHKAARAQATSGVSKIIELSGESEKSWDDAAQLCLAEAVRTIRNITSLSIEEFTAVVREDAVKFFKVRCKVAFSIDDSLRAH